MRHKILINLEPTPNCPAACSMCPRDSIGSFGFMQPELLERVVAQLRPDFVWEVDMAGRGEPTIHPEFIELVRIMSRPGIPTAVVTTGVSFTDANIEACARYVDRIRLSVSSIDPATFEKVHIGLRYKEIWKNISNLAKVAAPKVTVHLTGGPAIYDRLPETVAHLRSLGLERMYLFPLWSRGGDIATRDELALRRELMERLAIPASEREYLGQDGKLAMAAELVWNKLKNPYYCPVGDASLSISYKGDILGCFQDFGHTSNIGHIDDLRIDEILRQRVARLGRMEICAGCNANKVAKLF